METRNRLTVTGVGGRDEEKEGEGSSQETGIGDLWTRTTGWRLMVGAGGGRGRGEQMGGGWGQGGGIETTLIEQQ